MSTTTATTAQSNLHSVHSASSGNLGVYANQCEEQWQKLLRWLESKGMDASNLAVKPALLPNSGRGLVSIMNIEASSRIINIPYAALMNSNTLRPLHSNLPLEGFKNTLQASEDIAPLTGTQLLTIHLALHRSEGGIPSRDPTFGPYINTLPENFDSHPLTWSLNQRNGTVGDQEIHLLQNLPPSVQSLMDKVADRFLADKKVIYSYKDRYDGDLQPSSNLNDKNLLWAWLVVNTRCLYLRLFTEDLPLSNLTLGPLVDFANHPPLKASPLLQPPTHSSDLKKPKGKGAKKSEVFTFRSPVHSVLAGEELFLKYGDHPNATLFTEYGFVDNRDVNDGEVDVSDVLHKLMDELGEEGQQLKRFLEDHRCSDNMRLYGAPKPAYPSWGFLVALRILCDIAINRSSTIPPEGDPTSPWLQVISGLYTEECERHARNKLAWICRTVIARAQERNAVLGRDLDRHCRSSGSVPWFRWSLGCIQKLWEEEEAVARAVLCNVENGIEF